MGKKELVNDPQQDANQVKTKRTGNMPFVFSFPHPGQRLLYSASGLSLAEQLRFIRHLQCSMPGSSLGHMRVISGKSIVNSINYTEY